MRYQIKFTQLSFGVTREARAGDVVTDEDLAGADIEHLIAIGAIAEMGDAAAVVVDPDVEHSGDDGPTNLNKLTKSQIEDLADRLGIQLDPTQMTKAEMIQTIEESQSGGASEASEAEDVDEDPAGGDQDED